MASSLMHYAITDKILQLFPMHDGARLRFGAVLPDASVNKRKTHFRIYNEKLGIRLYNLESYRTQFGERMQKDDLYLGYYLHLIEDALYRKTLYDTFGWNPYTPESTARMHHDYTLLNRHFIQKYNIRDDLAVPENFTQEPIFAFEPFDAEGLLRSIHQNFVLAPADAPYFFTAAMADTYIEDAVRLCTAELDRFHSSKTLLSAEDFTWTPPENNKNF
ncbi:hypothetical protein [Hominenteromicrobium sp.]|uniref:hypothetical protein n=1 Tax=Hominenteromicrobium sp. TaxID=3073581 RepID=UPI003A91084A